MKKSRVYIGIEIKVREFEAKLFLACVAAEAEYDVILTQQRILKRKLEDMPPGIYIDKSVAADKSARHIQLKKLGFHVTAFDEEGLIFFNVDEYKKRRLSLETLKHIEHFGAWGPKQAEIVAEKAPFAKERIVPTGHPRIDLTRKELRGFYHEKVHELRERYGKFILINTNFGLCNHARGKDAAIDMLVKAGKILDEHQREYYLRLQDFKKKLFDEFVKMTITIHQRFPQIPIVLRPHPAENFEYWRQILPSDGQLHVEHEGNVYLWLMAADVVIHNSCMTGVEGFLLDRPVIAYQPIQDQDFDVYLPNVLSEGASSLDALLKMLEYHLRNNLEPQEQDIFEKRKIAEQYITGLNGLFASDRIVENFKHLSAHQTPWKITGYWFYRKMRKIGGLAVRGRFQDIFSSNGTTLEETQYGLQKFSGIDLDEIQQAISTFQGLTGRFSTIRVKQLERNMFQIVG